MTPRFTRKWKYHATAGLDIDQVPRGGAYSTTAMEETLGQPDPKYIKVDHPWISHDLMPIYWLTFPEKATNDELSALFQAREDWASRAKYPVAWIVDLSNITKASATQRKPFAEHLKRFEQYAVRWNAGSALIVPSAWLRGLVTAVSWISPPKFPNKLFSEPLEAVSWARVQLEAKLAELHTGVKAL